MTFLMNQMKRIPQIALMGALLAPGMAAAQSDLDITMRMVADDEALDSSFAQEMQIPESVNELDVDQSFETLEAGELSSEAQELSEGLSLQARETRDALNAELPGETAIEQPAIDLPGADLPGAELPGGDLPEPDLPVDQLPDPDLDLLQNSTSTLDSVTGQ